MNNLRLDSAFSLATLRKDDFNRRSSIVDGDTVHVCGTDKLNVSSQVWYVALAMHKVSWEKSYWKLIMKR